MELLVSFETEDEFVEAIGKLSSNAERIREGKPELFVSGVRSFSVLSDGRIRVHMFNGKSPIALGWRGSGAEIVDGFAESVIDMRIGTGEEP